MKFAKYPLTLAGLIGGIALGGGQVLAADYLTSGPYVSLGAGLSQPEVSHTTLIGPPVAAGFPNTSNPAKLSFDAGWNVLMSGGYKTESGLRGEIEMGWRQASVKNINSVPVSGRERVLSFMGNVLYDINTGSSISPYVGGGIGVGHIQFQNVQGVIGPSSTPSAIYSGHDTNFQWQAIGGVTIPIAEQLAAFIEYRYITLNNNNISSRSNPTSQIVNHDDTSHNFLVGLRYTFGHKEPVRYEMASAPPPPPPPPPPPAPPPVPEKVLAFFDFDKANLRSDAKEIVHQAADYAKSHDKMVIRVTGHTDTSGTAEYNMGLSKRRAMTVKAELIRLGIPEHEISVTWKGKSEPLIQTGDGVKEPQNRRVEIIYE